METHALVFDVDGTLVDDNAAHIAAWRQAFERLGYDVPKERIAPELGKGGEIIVSSIAGQAAEEKHGDALRKAHTEGFLAIAQATRFTMFPGAGDLLAAVRRQGLKIGIVSSSKKEIIEALERSSGIALANMCDVLVTAGEVAHTKPEPDLVQLACQKLGLEPRRCAFIGDSVHDAEACRKAGVAFLGVASGAWTADGLRQAGARRVFRDVGDLLSRLDDAFATLP